MSLEMKFPGFTISGGTYKLDESAGSITSPSSDIVDLDIPGNAIAGEWVNFVVVVKDGYEVTGLTATDADGQTVTVSKNGDQWSFVMPNTNVNIVLQYKKKTLKVSVAQTADATVTVNRATAQIDDKVTVTAKAPEGKRVSRVYAVDTKGNHVAATSGANNTWTFAMLCNDVTVRVEVVDADTPVMTFPDVHEGDWYYGPAAWAVESGAMHGFGNGTFGPLGTLTRGQAAAILHNLAGNPKADGSKVDEKFSDCSPNDFYAEAVMWTVDEGIFAGFDNGTFGPSTPISREQLCVVHYRMQGAPAATGSLSRFPDGANTSAFAIDAVRWATSQGLLLGDGNGNLRPTHSLNRAEGATILMRYTEKYA